MGAKGQWRRAEPISKLLHFTSTGNVLGKYTLAIYTSWMGLLLCVICLLNQNIQMHSTDHLHPSADVFIHLLIFFKIQENDYYIELKSQKQH